MLQEIQKPEKLESIPIFYQNHEEGARLMTI
jgi:hypothetical protein